MSDMGETTTIRGYEVQERIGAGGFGAVYRARQTTINREVAVKIIRPQLASTPDFIRRFETEAALVARLEHPFITPLIDYWRDPDGAFLVMRYLRGGSIYDALRDKAYDIHSVSPVLEQIASALDFAHRNNVIHRDIKPANVLLDEDGNAYLADFGIAKDLTSMQGDLTDAGGVVGSLDYISPEQARSDPVTPQTDIYSLGVMIYEMLIGEHPFKGCSPVERLYKHINDPLPQINGLSDDVRDDVNDIIQKATAKDPEKRYGDVLALAFAFRELTARDKTQNEQQMVEQLTLREHEVLQLIADGLTNREIADNLFITLATVKWHIKQLYSKLGVRNRVQAIVRARELDLIVIGNSEDGRSNGTSSSKISLPEPENPYKGLHAFQSVDARDFFGREVPTDKLIQKMQDNHIYQRFLAIVGPSGCGKSSLVRAGLIPALWTNGIPGSEKWFIVDFIPGEHPIDKLETALVRVAANHADNLHEQLSRNDRGLLRVADIILPDDDTEMLLVIDQFEEVFTLIEDEDERVQFLDLLYTAVIAPRSRVRVIITLRADYYDRPLHYPQIGEMLKARMETVLPLSAKGLERAIRGPAERVGITFESGLVEQIVSETNYQAGALPLLQYALTELYDRRQDRLLTHAAYVAIGGAGGALANRAEEIYESLPPEAQALTRQIFLRLVTLGEGAEDTRRRALITELLSLAEQPDMVEEIIDQYASYRLLSLDHDPATRQPTVEVAHEAILREWERLRQWLNASRDDIRQERQVAHIAIEWDVHQHDKSYLVGGARLEQIEKWQQTTKLILTPLEQEFITACIAQRKAQRKLHTEQQRQVRSLERRAKYVLGALVAVFAAAFLIAGTLAFQAHQNFIRAERIRLASQAQIALDNGEDMVIPALLSLQSLQLGYSPEADGTLLSALSQGFLRQKYVGHTEGIAGVGFSPDGNYVITANTDGTARLWDTQTGDEMRQFRGHRALVHDAVFTPDGQQIITVSNDGTARIWDVTSGEELHRISDHDGPVWGLDVSPDGRYILTSDASGLAYLWDAETTQRIQVFIGHDDTINRVAFSPDSRYIVTGSWDSTARLWEVASGDEVRRFDGHTDCVCGVDFAPDGRHILTGSYDHTVGLWDVTTGEIIRRFEGHRDVVLLVKFSPDGRLALTGSLDRTARVWNVATGNELRRVAGTGQGIAFSPDGRYGISGTIPGEAWLWDVEVDIEPRSFRFEGGVHEPTPILAVFSEDQTRLTIGMRAGALVTYDVETMRPVNTASIPTHSLLNIMVASPDNNLLMTGGSDGSARLFDAQNLEELWQFAGHQGAIRDISFSSDSLQIVTTGDDETARVWDAASGELRQELTGHVGSIHAVTFSADDHIVLTAGDDATVRFWDVESGALLHKLETGHGGTILDIALTLNGELMITASDDNTAQLWDMTTLQPGYKLVGHRAPVRVVAISRDGRYVLTGSDDLTVRLWDIETGATVRHIADHDTPVRMAMFAPSGQQIFVGTVFRGYIWRTQLLDVIALVCAQLPRDFTAAERTIYSINNDTTSCEAMD